MSYFNQSKQYRLWMVFLNVTLFCLAFSLIRRSGNLGQSSQTTYVFGWFTLTAAVCVALWMCQTAWKHTYAVALCAAIGYVSIYAFLSVNGKYEPAAYGLSGPKWYAWVPKGFAAEETWNQELYYAFGPLYLLDVNFWHRNE